MAETRRKMVKLVVVLVTKLMAGAMLNFQKVLKLYRKFSNCNHERWRCSVFTFRTMLGLTSKF